MFVSKIPTQHFAGYKVPPSTIQMIGKLNYTFGANSAYQALKTYGVYAYCQTMVVEGIQNQHSHCSNKERIV